MKLALGHKPRREPWGGGNRFALSLEAALAERGDQLVYDLNAPDIDIILIVDPRSRNPNVSFTLDEVRRYGLGHPETLVVHRINECDERKGTRGMNLRLRVANSLADHTVFIASWLKDLNVWLRGSASSVLLNGADGGIFNRSGFIPWQGEGPLRLVTHHWGAHKNKGFDVYQKLDRLLNEERWQKTFSLTYIGNIPANFPLGNVKRLPPLDGLQLAHEIKSHHAYLTASINEPAGMHHIEGALCGLPLLFRNSGALPEYCTGFGVGFNGAEDVEQALTALIDGYPNYCLGMEAYDKTAHNMCRAYLDLFDQLLAKRSELINRRSRRGGGLYRQLTRLPL